MIPHLTRSARPPGKLWTKHISGHTPAGQRATLLKGLGHLPEDTRGILSNCACLGEGVDVPVLDGVAFIDPKRSMVDIIQAVGRVIRKAAGKQLGTIVIPVFIDESEDADHVPSQSAFEPVWQVLKALRVHDRRLADELDQLRLSFGKRSARPSSKHWMKHIPVAVIERGRHNAGMKTISIHELHEETDQWVRQAAQYGEILVTDSGKSVAKLVPLNESPKRSSFKDWQPSPEFAAIMHRPVGGTDSTQIISEDRDRT